ncbi:splicing factor 3A subunit 1-like [Zingiber officinale]|uniref:SURP motif domain-containing protein n=1 Tax=Zingiber officinale TaxID=94328 RepID=A0A8J5F1Y4_ZINOF|nr:splicing factor 3A subunit 1-like [Zingiber officinale]KAG6476228.1 hypothetical protein ZIOFF_065466 [Zingiber officinale]
MREVRIPSGEEAVTGCRRSSAAAEECPRLVQEEREHIDKVARFVARDGDMTEAILQRLLRITKNHRRWGFISPDHPHHGYYLHRKISEQCRAIRPPR